MSFTLLIRRRAIDDTIAIHVHLEQQRIGLGDEFLLALTECYRHIERYPRGAQLRRGPYRHSMVKGFRSRVVYTIVGRRVYVYQVRHASQRPSGRFGP